MWWMSLVQAGTADVKRGVALLERGAFDDAEQQFDRALGRPLRDNWERMALEGRATARTYRLATHFDSVRADAAAVDFLAARDQGSSLPEAAVAVLCGLIEAAVVQDGPRRHPLLVEDLHRLAPSPATALYRCQAASGALVEQRCEQALTADAEIVTGVALRMATFHRSQDGSDEALAWVIRGMDARSDASLPPSVELARLEVSLRLSSPDAELSVAVETSMLLEPTDPVLHLLQGRLRENDGDALGAQAAFEHALRLDPTYSEAHYSLAVSLANADGSEERLTRAQQHLEAAQAHEARHLEGARFEQLVLTALAQVVEAQVPTP